MNVARVQVDGDPVAAAASLRALAPPGVSVSGTVSEIVASVRARGESALMEYVERFDRVDGPLRVERHECEEALAALDPAVRTGLEVAVRNVRAVAEAGMADDLDVALPEGQTVTLREVPVRRAAIYTPGGRNPYPSTVVMGVVTARAAGVDEVVVCAPGAHPVILAACALCGADEVWRMGGAHAVAALAYGTDTVRRVDVIAGPGSLYVQEAKRQVAGDVGIDGFAGPSDVLVLATAGADPRLVALDLLAQAEHGDGTIVVLVTDDAALREAVGAIVDAEAAGMDAAGALVLVPDPAAGLAVAEAFAPEHLQLMGGAAEALATEVRSAGCVFVGSQSATAFGDYVAGSNHTLPTGGAARFASGLSTRHFRRRMSVVRIGDAAGALARAGAPVAQAEGFDRHAASMRVRENPSG
ncbi:histidinol dehydrogenase [Baekduia soli]|uniref:Histidinol dehydrogenase n=1 Tax=Baekduia soli TaxID=496014 RepID=A0A5B8U8L9_9ACTN|nr:histidinol dehydrogenase [Baekduia soli]QEC49158.1 histidinol dehydrogenase [Baekduia soli]